jgi:hypothetical protein
MQQQRPGRDIHACQLHTAGFNNKRLPAAIQRLHSHAPRRYLQCGKREAHVPALGGCCARSSLREVAPCPPLHVRTCTAAQPSRSLCCRGDREAT